jgi:hypothetical protein
MLLSFRTTARIIFYQLNCFDALDKLESVFPFTVMKMASERMKRRSADGVNFTLDDIESSEYDLSRPASTATTPSADLRSYLSTDGGDDISIGSHVSNGNHSSCDSLADTDDMGSR